MGRYEPPRVVECEGGCYVDLRGRDGPPPGSFREDGPDWQPKVEYNRKTWAWLEPRTHGERMLKRHWTRCGFKDF